jgi:hypothetical protein
MSHGFNEMKATQAAGRLLERSGGPAHIMSLVRMLYLADREAILRWGHSITQDRFVFLKHGPVLSHVLGLLTEAEEPRRAPSAWAARIRPRDGAVEAHGAADYPLLSGEELEVLDEIASRHGGKAPWELAGLTRSLPEWREPRAGALPFTPQDILAAHRRSRPTPAEADPEEVYLNIHW